MRELSSDCAIPPFDSVSATNRARTGRLLSRKITQKRSRKSEEMTVRPGVSHGVEVAKEKKKKGGGVGGCGTVTAMAKRKMLLEKKKCIQGDSRASGTVYENIHDPLSPPECE